MISSFVRALISAFKARCELVPADELNRRHSVDAVLSKNTNELKTGAPGRFDRHRPMASPRSGACRRRCRRFEFPVRTGKTPSSNGMPRSRAETWTQARAAPGPERASRLRHSSPGLDSGPLGRPLFRRCTALSATHSPPLAQTWHSKIEIRDENRCFRNQVLVAAA